MLDFQSCGIDLPIDNEHQNDKPEAKLSGPVPAAGWIKELKIAEDGIWGRVEWTDAAAEMIGRKEYRFLSPSLLIHPKTRQSHRFKGAGLVHNPNLFLTALASQEYSMNPNSPANPAAPSADLGAQLATLLGLPPETTADELMKALAVRMKAQPDPSKFVPLEALQTTSEERVQFKISEASRKGYLAGGAMREWATELCRSDEDAFDRFLQTTAPSLAESPVRLSTRIRGAITRRAFKPVAVLSCLFGRHENQGPKTAPDGQLGALRPFPNRSPPMHELARPSLQSRIPLAKRWLAKMLNWKGYSAANIARTLRTATGSVRRYLKDEYAPSRDAGE